MSTILGLVIFALDVWAIVKVWQSGETTGTKILWTVLVILLPVIGLIAWYFAGPKK